MKFAESVMLIDVAFLNSVITDLERTFSRMLGRELDTVDLSALVSYMALDAGLPACSEQKIQVLLVYDDLSAKISHAQPSDVEKELNNVAFSNELGEFSFYAFQPEEFVGKEDFFIESVRVIAAEKEVRRLWIAAELPGKADKLDEALKGVDSQKETVLFRMSEPVCEESVRWELLGYPVMRALGVRGDELAE